MVWRGCASNAHTHIQWDMMGFNVRFMFYVLHFKIIHNVCVYRCRDTKRAADNGIPAFCCSFYCCCRVLLPAIFSSYTVRSIHARCIYPTKRKVLNDARCLLPADRDRQYIAAGWTERPPMHFIIIMCQWSDGLAKYAQCTTTRKYMDEPRNMYVPQTKRSYKCNIILYEYKCMTLGIGRPQRAWMMNRNEPEVDC